jgi:hypothetical protein
MILYLLRQYLILLVTILAGALFVSSFFFEIEYVLSSIPSVVFGGSAVALGWLYRRFEQRNLWVLYDNLQWPPLALLGGLFVGTQVVSLTLFLWL